MQDKKHIVILTGAGISAESGLKTFRDSDGLWMGYDLEEVATVSGFIKNPKLVLDFYNMRRNEVALASPNAAHYGLAKLEEKYKVTVITQNIDDLHERGGSSNVIHLHGEIFKKCSSLNQDIVVDCHNDINIGDLCEDGSQFRPFVVWFGESVPMISIAADIVNTADIFIVIGTSLSVYPAASLLSEAGANIPKYLIDNNPPAINNNDIKVISKTAGEGVAELLTYLL